MSVLEGALTTASASSGLKEFRVGVQGILLTSPTPERGCASLLLMQHLCAKGICKALFHHSGRACIFFALPLHSL